MSDFSAATVFHVSDIEKSLHFYVNQLTFEMDFRVGDYVGIKKDKVCIHLTSNNHRSQKVGFGHVYIFLWEIDAFYKMLIDKGVITNSEPTDYDYGMREFDLDDPDGNTISFGSGINEES